MLSLFQRPPQRKASATGPVAAIHGAGRPVWTPRDLTSLTRQSYLTNAIANRCVRLIAEGAASLPLTVKADGKAVTDHPLLALLSRPNPAQDCCALLEALYGHLQIAGNAYLEAVPSPTEPAPRELYALRPDRMRVIPGRKGWPEGYEYRLGTRSVRFRQTEEVQPILHIKTFHPLDDHYGLSPLEAAAVPVDVHNAASRWNKALLDNAARPSGAMVYNSDGGAPLSPVQFERLKNELQTRHQGAGNAGRPMLLEGGLDWKPMGFSPSDMEFMKGKDAAAREIALAFGVPPLVLGLPGDNTHANYAEANRAFTAQTLRPLVSRTLSAMGRWLSPKYGEEIEIAVEEGEETLKQP